TVYSPQLPMRSLMTATRLPFRSIPSKPPPDFSTTPTPSNPGVAGSGGFSPYLPWTYITSDGLIGLASIRTSTSPRAGTGGGTSRTWSTSAGGPNRSNTMAFTRELRNTVVGTGRGGHYRDGVRF